MAARTGGKQQGEVVMAFLCAGDLLMDDFLAAVHDASWPKDSLMMVLSPTLEPFFDPFHFDQDYLRASEQGRIFWGEGEFKWRGIGVAMRTVYLGKDVPPVALPDYSHKLDGLTDELEEFVLWGVRSDLENEWIEQQVPHRFAYPVNGKKFSRGRVSLVVQHWVDASGIPKFSRYQSLREIEGVSHASG